ncbi:MAG: diacylglycerol kinase family protein [Desulfitobacteriaceae bacterium]|nr:diacylglycerol kinase family protein [Desulfitobacteriaceae bacterium]
MKYFLIMNPGSAGGKSKEKIAQILAAFRKGRIDFHHQLTNHLEDAYHLSLNANQKDYDVVVAVGGDGTINRVINGFYDASGRRISEAKLGVIHTGTSPDFSKSFRLPLDVNEAIETVLKGNTRKISIGKITCARHCEPALDNQPLNFYSENVQYRFFACCANIGLGASVARIANSGVRKYLGDTGGTFLALIQTLFHYRPGNFIISFEGEQKVLENVYNISVGKTSYIASGIKVKHHLSCLDERFYQLIVKNVGFGDWLGVIKKVYSGQKFTNSETVSLHYAEVIEVFGNSKNGQVEFDGDPAGYLPCRIETAPDPLDLISEVQDE